MARFCIIGDFEKACRIIRKVFFCSALLTALSATSQAEIATREEMNRVCRNWLTKTVIQSGQWAGSTDPEIIATEDIAAGDTVLARIYSISPSGFVVVPTLKELSPIKAYSEKSVLDERQEGGFLALLRETLTQYFQIYANRYGSLEATQDDSSAIFDPRQRRNWTEFTKPKEEFVTGCLVAKSAAIEGGPLLTTSWHQRDPYNYYCPIGNGGRSVVGCVATAAAQILAYWRWPQEGMGEHSYLWDGDNSCGGNTSPAILTAYYSDSYDWASVIDNDHYGYNTDQRNAVAELNYEVGVAFDMDYGVCASAAWTANGLHVFPVYFKYSTDIHVEYRIDHTVESWFNVFREEIDNGRPSQYRINLHSIVCDGYRDQGYGQLEYHMNYGWDNGFTTWFVLDNLYCYWLGGDEICPYEEELAVVSIYPQNEPLFLYVGNSINDMNDNGAIEPGETFTLSLIIENLGLDAVNTTADFSCSDEYIGITSASLSFQETIQWGDTAASLNQIELAVSPDCPTRHFITLNYTINESGGYSQTDSVFLYVGSDAGYSADFESDAAYWNNKIFTPTFRNQWHLETHRAHSGVTSWKYGGEGANPYSNGSDGALISPPILLAPNSTLTFWHWMDAESDANPDSAWDGGNIWISSGDGNWTLIYPENGYPRGIIANPASPFEPGTPCYSGTFDWSQAIFDLSAYSGIIQVMFRFGSDGLVSGEGWYIDDMVISGDPPYLCGDANGDDEINVGDAVFIINSVFKGGPLPEPIEAGDANADGETNVGDAVYIINHVFKGGSPPCA